MYIPQSDILPFVSIIMPIKNEELFIRKSLSALLSQDYPHDHYEVIIVDGMSTDQTRELIKKMVLESDVEVILKDNPKIIVPTAMNIGIRTARGDIIVRMDGHTIAAHDYLSEAVKALKRTGADNVGGRMDRIAENIFGKGVALATSHLFGIGNAKFHYVNHVNKDQEVDTVFPGTWWRKTFEKFGMFDEYFVRTQDSEFNYRIHMLGGRIWLCPSIRTKYYCRSSPKTLAKQYFQYGFWKTRLMFKIRESLLPRHFAAPILIIGLLISFFLVFSGILFSARGLLNLGLVIPSIYFIFLFIGAVHCAVKNKVLQLFPLLIVIFMILHSSWGIGFLLGLIKRPPKDQFAPLPLIKEY